MLCRGLALTLTATIHRVISHYVHSRVQRFRLFCFPDWESSGRRIERTLCVRSTLHFRHLLPKAFHSCFFLQCRGRPTLRSQRCTCLWSLHPCVDFGVFGSRRDAMRSSIPLDGDAITLLSGCELHGSARTFCQIWMLIITAHLLGCLLCSRHDHRDRNHRHVTMPCRFQQAAHVSQGLGRLMFCTAFIGRCSSARAPHLDVSRHPAIRSST